MRDNWTAMVQIWRARGSLTVASWLALSLVCSTALVAAPIERKGSYWVETITASVPVNPDTRFKVVTRGAIVLRGTTARRATYKLRKQVKGGSKVEAVRLLSPLTMRLQPAKGWTALALTGDTPRETAGIDLELTVPNSLQQLVLRTSSGEIAVSSIRTALDAESKAGALRFESIQGGLIARTGGGEIRLGGVAGPVRCWSAGGSISVARVSGEAWLETAGGEIYVEDARGPLYVSTGGGNIRVERAAASVTAQTGGGRIDIPWAAGPVKAANSGGSILVGSAQGCQCESTAGAIRLPGASGLLRAISDAGSIWAQLAAGAPLRNSQLSSRSGDITVIIPSNLALTVLAKTSEGRAGRIVSDFAEIPVARAAAEGSLNGGGPLLRISAPAGTIYLRKQKQDE